MAVDQVSVCLLSLMWLVAPFHPKLTFEDEAYAGTSSNPALSLFSFGSLGIRSTEPLLVLRRDYPRRITREERFI